DQRFDQPGVASIADRLAEIPRLDAELTPFADDYRHVTEKACDRRDVEGRGHDKNAQLRADEALRGEREREPEVGVQAALVELIEEEQTDALQRRIVLERPGQRSFGD